MLLLRTNRLPEGAIWEYELKLDGYRAIAFKSGARVHLRSRNDKDFTTRYAEVVKALAKLPDDTVIDGELVGFDDAGLSFQRVAERWVAGPRRYRTSLYFSCRAAGDPLSTAG